MVRAELTHKPVGDGVRAEISAKPTARVTALMPRQPTAHVTAHLEVG